ncbi:MAG: phosphoribosylanthranilate isomerase [Oscillatoriales cyanobacterium C42_A2020_001]|nr:phosphoribosylanthranilate isomerase [Leptolyngbyaceae cyanobacterium C42_A2020_001]
MGLRVKVCGITEPEQGRAIAELGATALGFMCVLESPRYITPEQIARIVAALPTQAQTGKILCERVGVFRNASLGQIAETVAIANLNAVQLHGDESPEFCHELRQHLPDVELIKALRVQSIEVLHQAAIYEAWVDTLLLDAYHPQLAGGTGKTLNWKTLQQFQPNVPWFLAGGLNPDNVLEALALVQPGGIDLSSGLELAPGKKDLNKVAKLFSNLQAFC